MDLGIRDQRQFIHHQEATRPSREALRLSCTSRRDAKSSPGDKLSSRQDVQRIHLFPDRRLGEYDQKVVEDKEATSALKEAWEKKKIAAEAKGEEFSKTNPNR